MNIQKFFGLVSQLLFFLNNLNHFLLLLVVNKYMYIRKKYAGFGCCLNKFGPLLDVKFCVQVLKKAALHRSVTLRLTRFGTLALLWLFMLLKLFDRIGDDGAG